MLDVLFGRFRAHPSSDDLSAHADGRLTGAALSRLGAHLETCTACAGDLKSLTATKGYLQALTQVATPRSFYLLALAAEEALPFWLSWLPTLRIATAAAAVVLVLAVGLEGGPGRAGVTTFDRREAVPAAVPAQESAGAGDQSALKASDAAQPPPTDQPRTPSSFSARSGGAAAPAAPSPPQPQADAGSSTNQAPAGSGSAGAASSGPTAAGPAAAPSTASPLGPVATGAGALLVFLAAATLAATIAGRRRLL